MLWKMVVSLMIKRTRKLYISPNILNRSMLCAVITYKLSSSVSKSIIMGTHLLYDFSGQFWIIEVTRAYIENGCWCTDNNDLETLLYRTLVSCWVDYSCKSLSLVIEELRIGSMPIFGVVYDTTLVEFSLLHSHLLPSILLVCVHCEL